MYIDHFIDKMLKNADKEAVIYKDEIYSYGYLNERIGYWQSIIRKDIVPGAVVALQSDFNTDAISILLALIENSNVIVPINIQSKDVTNKLRVAEVEDHILFDCNGYKHTKTENISIHKYIQQLKDSSKPGIIIFSSGSTGEPKAALHDFTLLLEKYKHVRQPLRTLIFLLFDHWGGLNTLFHILSNGGVVGVPEKNAPDAICGFIEKYKIELLPTTPTFINMILYSKVYENYDLSSLKIISYGTEPMHESTLKAFNRIFPEIRLKQTYGLTELGVMNSKSKSSDSLWMKVGGSGYETKVVNNILFIKAESTILGYLNAEVPIDSDGWYNTGDKVEQDGEWIKILGRESEMINVGGQKVNPAEVESVILEIDNIIDVTISAVTNPILGQVVGARINLENDESLYDIKKRIQKHCAARLEKYKIPVHVEIVSQEQFSERFKRIRL
ncbi:MAG: fatty acid--CoA ligase family protein [Bacteroidetes bacterium]|nr:fatty acid--CoA ligase family protein [Bacteroidota bacterium]